MYMYINIYSKVFISYEFVIKTQFCMDIIYNTISYGTN